MTPDDLQSFVALGREQRHVEFKSAGSLDDKNLRGKVFRAIMAMANLRDGGTVIIGVAERADGLEATGLEPADLATWDASTLADRLRKYADPQPEFVLEHVEWEGRWFVALSVRQFSVTPVLCSADYTEVDENGKQRPLLRAGACYVRTQGSKPESREVPTHGDMRDVLDLAVELGVRRFVETAHRAGLAAARVEDPYAQERVEFDSDALLTKLRRRGYWRVEIYPAQLVERRIDGVQDLERLMAGLRISRSPVPYPARDRENAGRIGNDWIGYSAHSHTRIDTWRLWCSGCFIHERAYWYDWLDESPFGTRSAAWAPETEFWVADAIAMLSDVHEFAARLALSSAGAANMVVRLSAKKLGARVLKFPNEDWFDDGRHVAKASEWSSSGQVVSRDVLIADPKELALNSASDLFYRFGWRGTIGALRGIQQQQNRGQ